MGKGRPQQQEISRSERTPVVHESREQRAAEEETQAPGRGRKRLQRGLPPDNRPGHHPPKDQDKPADLGGAGHGTGKRKGRS